MTEKEFLRAVANDETDMIRLLLELLRRAGAPYCVIDGLAVNAYAEPVVSLDLDVVVAAREVEPLCREAGERGLRIERFEQSINLGSPKSDLRIQLQTDERYQEFIPRAERRKVLGYEMQVARLEDVLRGKLWACQDETRRRSKRQKDLADIARLVEARPELLDELPEAVRKQVE